MAPEGQPVEPDLVAQAVAAGVEHIVLLSSAAIEVMGDERLMAAENTVRSCGLDWTIVRPNWFDQNFNEGFLRAPVLAGTVTLPLRDSRHPFVDAVDIAAMVATALTEPGHAGHTHVVTGPEELTFAQAVQTIAQASGKPLSYRGEPEDHLAAAAAAGIAPNDAQAQLAFNALYRHPRPQQRPAPCGQSPAASRPHSPPTRRGRPPRGPGRTSKQRHNRHRARAIAEDCRQVIQLALDAWVGSVVILSRDERKCERIEVVSVQLTDALRGEAPAASDFPKSPTAPPPQCRHTMTIAGIWDSSNAKLASIFIRGHMVTHVIQVADVETSLACYLRIFAPVLPHRRNAADPGGMSASRSFPGA